MDKQQVMVVLIKLLSTLITSTLFYTIEYYFYNKFLGFKSKTYLFILYTVFMIIANFVLIIIPINQLKIFLHIIGEFLILYTLYRGNFILKTYALIAKETILLLINIFFLPLDFWILPLSHNKLMSFSNHMLISFIDITFRDVISLTILFVFLKIISNLLDLKNKELKLYHSLYLLIPCFSNFCFAIIFYSIQVFKINNTAYSLPNIFGKVYLLLPLASFLVLISIPITSYIFKKMLEGEELTQKNLLMKQQIELQVDHVKTINNFYSGIRTAMHDINNHLICIGNLANLNNIDELKIYLNNINENLAKLEIQIKTGNPIADVIVNEKYKTAKSANIEFQCDFIMPKVSLLQPEDICAILGNALDNAIEACAKIAEDNITKKISLKSYIRDMYLIIEISNSSSTYIKYDGEKIISTKPDVFNHGIGINNIKCTVQKYNGIIDIIEEKNKFTLSLMLKIK